MKTWRPELDGGGPLYMALVDAIEKDLRAGRLSAGDRLPPHRELAKRLDINVTTVARGYVEAQKRGLVESHVGRGTFLANGARPHAPAATSRTDAADPSMNMPPEPDDPALLARMREGVSALADDIVPLMRYQTFGGTAADKDAAALWLARRGLTPPRDRVFVAPGAHPSLLAIFSMLTRPGDVVLAENVTYPGMRAIAAQLRLRLVGLEMDDQGALPDAFAKACETENPRAIYLNPTLHNPLTLTMPEARRREIAATARRHNVPIVEDDAYGFIPERAPMPLAAMAPELTWHVAGLAKCLGAGLRLAYVAAPDDGRAVWSFAAAMRAGNLMASPLTAALATRWIGDGVADEILRFIRAETEARQTLVARLLPKVDYRADRLSFNIWLPLPNGWTRSAFIAHMQASGFGLLAGDAFAVSGPAPEAARVSICGPLSRSRLQAALEFMAHTLETPPEMVGSFF